MPLAFRRVALIGKHYSPEIAASLRELRGLLEKRGCDVLIEKETVSAFGNATRGLDYEAIGGGADLAIVVGGDGTMLRAMRLADGQRAPVLGVNLGKLGFLAEVDVPDLPAALSAIDTSDFTIEPRLAIDTVVGGQRGTAFNDIAVDRGA